MKFLLDTVIPWEGHSVYYTIYIIAPDIFFAAVQDNPARIASAVDFCFYGKGEYKSETLSERQMFWLDETMQRYFN